MMLRRGGLLLTLALLTLLAACSRAQTGSTVESDEGIAAAPLTCTIDAQCMVKNVGNCCGAYPACVHVDQAVDPAAVKQRCEADGRSSVCGFKEIQACRCDAGLCAESPVNTAESAK